MSRHRPVAETRLALIRAALQIVAEDGVYAATTRRIVAVAGVPLASFHYAFASHEELMSEVVKYAVSEEYRSVEPVASTISFGLGARALASTPPDQVPSVHEFAVQSLEAYVAGLRADPQREKAMLVLTFWALRGESDQRLAQTQYARYDELALEVLETVGEATGCGWRMPLADMATLLVALIDGMTISWLVWRDDAKARVLIEAAAELIDGYAVPAEAAQAAVAQASTRPEPDRAATAPDPAESTE